MGKRRENRVGLSVLVAFMRGTLESKNAHFDQP